MDTKTNRIPPMTDPMGVYWKQPSPDAIAIDDTHALMTQATFNQLSEYSSSKPSGVYHGKMWRRHDGLHDPRCPASRRRWLLCWYGESSNPAMCSVNFRLVLLA